MKKIIEKEKYIFVDCFDTVVWRSIKENHVLSVCFERIGNTVGVDGDFLIDIWNFVKRTDLCIDGREERTFKELTDDLYLRVSYCYRLCCSIDEFYIICITAFLEIEKSVDKANQDIISVLQVAKNEGQKIICVSDFYLPGTIVMALFEHLGVGSLFDEIFISSDIGKRKSTGSLYNFIISKLKINANDAIMIGDNKHSDYLMALNCGLNAYLYQKNFYRKSEKDLFLAYQELYCKNCNDNIYLANYVFVLFYFCQRLYKKLQERKAHKVYFMAREGEFLKELFDNYLRLSEDNINIDTIYMYVSRQATFIASLGPLEDEQFLVLRKDSPNISIRLFLKSLNLYEKITSCKDIKLDLNLEVIIDNFFSSNELNVLKNNKIFRAFYEEERIKQRSEILNYFEKIGLSNSNEAIIVDVGWKGSIQDNLSHLFGNQLSFVGYYLGLIGNVSIGENNIKEGLIFSNVPINSKYFHIFKIRYRILERIAYASHATCIGYHNGEALFDYYNVKESELYRYVRPIQQRIKSEFAYLFELEKMLIFNKQRTEICIMGIYRIFCLDLNKKRLKQMKFMDERMSLDFGARGKNITSGLKIRLRNLVRNIYYMDIVEKIQKVIIISYNVNLLPLAFVLRKIALLWVKMDINKKLN